MSSLTPDPEEEIEPASWEDMRDRVIQSAIMLPDTAFAEAQRAELRSQSMALLRAFIDEGIRVAKDRGFEPMTPEAWKVIEPLSSIATDVISSLPLTRFPIYMEERAELEPDQIRQNLLGYPSNSSERSSGGSRKKSANAG